MARRAVPSGRADAGSGVRTSSYRPAPVRVRVSWAIATMRLTTAGRPTGTWISTRHGRPSGLATSGATIGPSSSAMASVSRICRATIGLPAAVAPCGEREQPEDHQDRRGHRQDHECGGQHVGPPPSCPLRHRSGAGVKRDGRRDGGGAATRRGTARGRPGSRPGPPPAGNGRRGSPGPGRRPPSRARWQPGPSRGSAAAASPQRARTGQAMRRRPRSAASSSTSTVAPAR